MIAASILNICGGFRNFKEIEGGFNAIAKTELPKTDFLYVKVKFCNKLSFTE
jgi:hypothetical protein